MENMDRKKGASERKEGKKEDDIFKSALEKVVERNKKALKELSKH